MALGDHPGDHVGQGRAVDAGGADQGRLGDALVLGHGRQHGELALGDAGRAAFLGVDVEGQLQDPMQQMAGRPLQQAAALFALGLGHDFTLVRSADGQRLSSLDVVLTTGGPWSA
jgi:hypothetical protein